MIKSFITISYFWSFVGLWDMIPNISFFCSPTVKTQNLFHDFPLEREDKFHIERRKILVLCCLSAAVVCRSRWGWRGVGVGRWWRMETFYEGERFHRLRCSSCRDAYRLGSLMYPTRDTNRMNSPSHWASGSFKSYSLISLEAPN